MDLRLTLCRSTTWPTICELTSLWMILQVLKLTVWYVKRLFIDVVKCKCSASSTRISEEAKPKLGSLLLYQFVLYKPLLANFDAPCVTLFCFRLVIGINLNICIYNLVSRQRFFSKMLTSKREKACTWDLCVYIVNTSSSWRRSTNQRLGESQIRLAESLKLSPRKEWDGKLWWTSCAPKWDKEV